LLAGSPIRSKSRVNNSTGNFLGRSVAAHPLPFLPAMRLNKSFRPMADRLRGLAGLREAVILSALITVAAVLRLAVVNPDGLQADEALFAAYGVHVASTADLLLLHAGFPLEYMPVVFWILGASIKLLGNSPLVIRLPGLGASLITVVCV
jgi:hypothetical protein